MMLMKWMAITQDCLDRKYSYKNGETCKYIKLIPHGHYRRIPLTDKYGTLDGFISTKALAIKHINYKGVINCITGPCTKEQNLEQPLEDINMQYFEKEGSDMQPEDNQEDVKSLQGEAFWFNNKDGSSSYANYNFPIINNYNEQLNLNNTQDDNKTCKLSNYGAYDVSKYNSLYYGQSVGILPYETILLITGYAGATLAVAMAAMTGGILMSSMLGIFLAAKGLYSLIKDENCIIY